VVIEASDDLELLAPVKLDPAHDVHLPEFHGATPFPSTIVLAPATPLLGIDEAVTEETAISGRTAGKRDDPLHVQLMAKCSWSPARMGLPELEDADLGLRGQLMGAGRRPAGMIGGPGKTDRGIAPEPAMNGLAGDPVSKGHVAGWRSIKDLEHRLVPLFHQS
jgi:hypothetical protein